MLAEKELGNTMAGEGIGNVSLIDYNRLNSAIEEAKANKEIEKVSGIQGLDQLAEAARGALDDLYGQLEKMEVYDNASN